MPTARRVLALLAASIAASAVPITVRTPVASAQSLRTPAEFVGHPVGADRKLFGWDRVLEYFRLADRASDRVRVVELGKTTLDRPMILAIASSPENLKRADEIRAAQRRLVWEADRLDAAEVARLAKTQPAIAMITLNIHSTEIASSQESVELIHRLATDTSAWMRDVLDRVVVLLVPSLNPDGMQMVVDWYTKYVGTPYEGAPLPFLYHHYAGHDNNRDWFMMRLAETRHVSRVYYHDWLPEIVYDQHQMGSGSARLFLPPYADPVNPNVHPLLYAEMDALGKKIVADLTAQGLKGIVTGAFYTAEWPGTSIMTPWWHNQIGMLSEMASARIATPLYFPEGSLQGGRRGLPEYKQQSNFLAPWEGGWWRLRDIIDYEAAITWSYLDHVARRREELITGFWRMNRDAIERGRTRAPYAYVVPRDPNDPGAAALMVDILMQGGLRAHEATATFTVDRTSYPAGTWVFLAAQPFRPYLVDLMEPQRYPELRPYPGGPPTRPYDMTGWTLPYQMGVTVRRVDARFEADLEPLSEPPKIEGGLAGAAGRYAVVDHAPYKVATLQARLLKAGVPVFWATEAIEAEGVPYRPGALVVPLADGERAARVAGELAALGLEGVRTGAALGGRPALRLRAPRVGLYQPHLPNMDEGWTRRVLDELEIAYATIRNEEVKRGNLRDRFDAIVLADQSPASIKDGRTREDADAYSPEIPPEYRGGLGKEGIAALKAFVEAGGTLVTFDDASLFAIKELGLPAEDALDRLSDREFFAPGTIVKIELDPSEPVAFGMPDSAAAYFVSSTAFRPLAWHRRTGVVARYAPKEEVLMSGWIEGPEHLEGKAALLDVPMGQGRVILFAFRPQHRAQTYATFPLVANALFLSAAESAAIPGARPTE